jgi:hypothetical protein
MEEIKFNVRTICLSPFNKAFKWDGFVRENQIILSDSEIIILKKNKTVSYPYAKLDFCIVWRRMMNLRNSCIYLGYSEAAGQIRGEYCYLQPDNCQTLLDELKERNAKCFLLENKVVTATCPWYSLNRNKDTLWLNNQYVISSDLAKRSILFKPQYPLLIGSIKFVFTQMGNLRLGPDPQLMVKSVSKFNVMDTNLYLADAGCQVCAKMDVAYDSLGYGFTHATIGFNDKGLIYSYKNRTDVDRAFLPYDKINLFSCFGLGWFYTLIILGEQNIMPNIIFSLPDTRSIYEQLKAHGVASVKDGKIYRASLHSSWYGILFSFLTLGIYHLLVSLFLKLRNKQANAAIICENKVVTRGKIYRHTGDDETSFNRTSFFACAADIENVKAVVYIKKKWFYLWGTVFMRMQPENIREEVDAEGNASVKYDFEMHNVWFWRYYLLIHRLKSRGYKSNLMFRKQYKKWVKKAFKYLLK